MLLSPEPETAWFVRSREMVAQLDPRWILGFDVVLLEQAHTASLLPEIRRAGVPVLLVSENVEHQVSKQLAELTPWSRARLRIELNTYRLRRLERKAVRGVDAVTAVSVAEQEVLAQLRRNGPVGLVPNGVDVDYFGWNDHAVNRGDRLLLTAHLGYKPNVDGCVWMAHEVMPILRRALPTAHLSLVGMAPHPSVQRLHRPEEGIEVIGEVEDVRPYMVAADLFVIPLRVGGGTRLKALEALSVGLPVVATSRGVEGLDAVRAGVVSVGNSAEEVAAEVTRMLSDEEARRRVGRAGRTFVENRYSWPAIGERLEHQIIGMVNSHRSPR